MGTRCMLGIKREDGIIESVFCHYDGYPSGAGKQLLNDYNTEEKAKELIAIGEQRSVGDKFDITQYHRFPDEPEEPEFYEDDNEDVFFRSYDVNFYYLWKENKWFVFGYFCTGEGRVDLIQELTPELATESIDCVICNTLDDGTVETIYVQQGGEISSTGKILLSEYTNAELIQNLFDSERDKKHGVGKRDNLEIKGLEWDWKDCYYAYLWKENKWFVSELRTGKPIFVELTNDLIESYVPPKI